MMRSHALPPPVHSAREAWAAARRILCVRLDALGDVLMTTPALRALKAAGTGRELTLLASPAGAPAARHVPDIDHVLVYEAPWVKYPHPPEPAAFETLLSTLRAGRYDAAVIFTVYSQSALPAAMLCWQAGIPLRLAYSRENPYHLLSDWEPEREPEPLLRHEVVRQLELVASVGARTGDTRMAFRLHAEDDARALRILHAAGVDAERGWIVVYPGASAASRRYPIAQYAAALRRFAHVRHRPVLVTGSAAERTLIEELVAQLPGAVGLAGTLSIGELACVLARAALLVANNTGPTHIAAALGTPTVVLYALTNPQHTPWQVPHRVLTHDVPCRWCYRSVCVSGHHDCLRGVRPEDVARAALELLEETRVPSRAVTAEACVFDNRRPRQEERLCTR